MNRFINELLSALNEIDVRGKKNHELLLGCILMAEKLKKELEGVYHAPRNSERENASGEDSEQTAGDE